MTAQVSKNTELSFLETSVLSGTAAVIAKTVSAPIERVKLMIQNQDEMMKQGRIEQPYKGNWDCTVRTFRAEGEPLPPILLSFARNSTFLARKRSQLHSLFPDTGA